MVAEINGKRTGLQEPAIAVTNRSFRYGDSVFESMLLIKGHLPLWNEHWERLLKGCKILGILPGKSSFWFKERIRQLAKAEAIEFGRVRLSVYREGGGTYFPETSESGYALEILPLDEETVLPNMSNLLVDVYPEHRKPIHDLGAVKSANALLYVLAGSWAKSNGLSDAILLNEKGNICESVNSNIFLVKDKCLLTPALSEGCLPGVMRQTVIQLAKNHGMPCFEDAVRLQDLEVADEILLTNAVWGIQSVMGIGKRRFFRETGQQLMEWLKEEIHSKRLPKEPKSKA